MSSLKFGTSGLRGLVVDLVGRPSHDYALAFFRYLLASGGVGGRVFVGRDLRSSSPEIARNVVAAARAADLEPVDCGAVPTPALALQSLSNRAPAVMVTGSHIPDDRNGLKFYVPDGEIGKDDEAGILAEFDKLTEDTAGDAASSGEAHPLDAIEPYRRRYIDFFGSDALAGLRIGVYQHSSVARDILTDILDALGARTTALGRSERFIPVDTEAHRPEDLRQIAEWTASGSFDAIVSTDGDADRPLVADEGGRILRGDILGLLTARHLGLRTIVTPVTSSRAIESSGIGTRVVRTKVGSPFVIAGMADAAARGAGDVVGFEANGGLLLYSTVRRDDRTLAALPTRDAVLPILAALVESRARGATLSEVIAALGASYAAAHRLQDVPADRSGPFLERLGSDAEYRDAFFRPVGKVAETSGLDGVKMLLESGETVHFRASGNAPELRCYVEADDEARAGALLEWGLASAEAALR